jgi:hypothetical protein
MKVKCLDGLGLGLCEDRFGVRVTDQLKGRVLGLRGLPRCRAAWTAP